jgi:hypothetical protein
MSDNKYTLDDIIDFSVEQQPVEVKAAVDQLMLAKIHSAIEDKKVEVAKQMFGDAAGPEDPDLSDDTWEDDETEDLESDEGEEDDADDFDLDISDDELEELLSDLEDNLGDEADDDLGDDNSDLEDTENGEDA